MPLGDTAFFDLAHAILVDCPSQPAATSQRTDLRAAEGDGEERGTSLILSSSFVFASSTAGAGAYPHISGVPFCLPVRVSAPTSKATGDEFELSGLGCLRRAGGEDRDRADLRGGDSNGRKFAPDACLAIPTLRNKRSENGILETPGRRPRVASRGRRGGRPRRRPRRRSPRRSSRPFDTRWGVLVDLDPAGRSGLEDGWAGEDLDQPRSAWPARPGSRRPAKGPGSPGATEPPAR